MSSNTEEQDYRSFSTEQLCSSKSWKARLLGYEQLLKIFSNLGDEKSSEWNKYIGLVKGLVDDNNVACQEKGLEAVLMFVENCGVSVKCLGGLASSVVHKCLAAPRPKVRQLGTQVLFSFIELEKHQAVMEELLEGARAKNPKVRAASVGAILGAVRGFGPRVFSVNSKTLKELAVLSEDKDKSVREETRLLLGCLLHWLGDRFRPSIVPLLKPNVMSDVEAEFEKNKTTTLAPTRFFRSEQDRIQQQPSPTSTKLTLPGEKQSSDDDYDILPSVNILNKVTPEFYSRLNSKKWSDRKDILEDLAKQLIMSPKLENGDYSEIVRQLGRIISKDSNVQVVIAAIRCLTGISKGLRMNFKQYLNLVTSSLFEKFKEKKQNVVIALREAVDSLVVCTSFEILNENIITFLDDKNPSIKSEVASFLTRFFRQVVPSMFNKKQQKLLCLRLRNSLRDQDPSVRENSAEALGTLMKLVGDKTVSQHLSGIDDVCMRKVREFSDKAELKTLCSNPVPLQTDEPVKILPKKQLVTKSVKNITRIKRIENVSAIKSTKVKENEKCLQIKNKNQNISNLELSDPKVNLSKTDIKSKLSDSLIRDISHSDWKVRLEGLKKLKNIVTSAQTITSHLGEVDSLIAERILDNNNRIAENAISLVECIAIAMGQSSKKYIPTFLPVLMKALGDKRTSVRTSALCCMDTWARICGVDKLLEGPTCSDALKRGTPAVQAEIWSWLAENVTSKQVREDCLCPLLRQLYEHLSGRHNEVRKRAAQAVPEIMAKLGYEKMLAALENISGTKSSSLSIKEILEKAKCTVPLQPFVKSEKHNLPHDTIIPMDVPNVEIKASAKPRAPLSSSMLQHNNLKLQRIIDQDKFKWGNIPIKEITEDLKKSMVVANVYSDLISDMFHSDIRFHIRAFERLADDLPSNIDGLKCNLDMILRWISLKCLDNNLSVLTKCLDYLNLIFKILKEEGYELLDSEASSIMPNIIEKMGDPKEIVRTKLRSILKLFSFLYPPRKQFTHFMNGLKSRNIRYKLECVEQLKWLINTFDIKICQPTLASNLKLIEALVGEKDVAVRNCAIHLIVAIFQSEGEKVFKLIKIPYKIRTIVEEKALRTYENLSDNNLEMEVDSVQTSLDENINFVGDKTVEEIVSVQTEISKDYYWVNELDFETKDLCFQSPKLLHIDLEFLNDYTPQKIQRTDKFLLDMQLTRREDLVNRVSNEISAVQNFSNMEVTLNYSSQINGLFKKMIANLIKLFTELKNKNVPGADEYYYSAFSMMGNILDNIDLCSQIMEDNLYRLFEQLLLFIAEGKADGNAFTRSVNGLIFSLLENANKSSAISALIRLLMSGEELANRCLWRLTKALPTFEKDLDYQRILIAANHFFKVPRKAIISDGTKDASQKTVKYLIFSMLNLNESKLLESFNELPDYSKSSEIRFILKKFSKHNLNKTEIVEYKNINAGSSNVQQKNFCTNEDDGKRELISDKIATSSPDVWWRRLNSLKEKLNLPTEETRSISPKEQTLYPAYLQDKLRKIHSYI